MVLDQAQCTLSLIQRFQCGIIIFPSVFSIKEKKKVLFFAPDSSSKQVKDPASGEDKLWGFQAISKHFILKI